MTPLHQTRTGKCVFCGRPVTLRREFEGNPGQSPQQRALEAERAAEAWRPVVFIHPRCELKQQLDGQSSIDLFTED